MNPLAGKKILLIGIGFYDYEAAIAAEFRSLGAEVWVEDERPPEMRGRAAGLYRWMKLDMTAACARHLAAMLVRVRSAGPLDHVVVIKGTLLDAGFLAALRDAQPRAMFTAYHWDSMARFPELIQRQSLFDRVLTFDRIDAATHPNFILRPLFFRHELTRAAALDDRDVDVSFVGWLHHQRLAQVEHIRKEVESRGLVGSYYLSTGAATRLRLSLAGQGRDVHSRPLSFSDYVNTISRARSILDLPHPQQAGLTMRAIEAVGTGRKLITTARDVVFYDFYRSENILIIDGNKPDIDRDFILSKSVLLPLELVERYSLRTWCLDVLGVCEPRGFIRTTRDEADDRAALYV